MDFSSQLETYSHSVYAMQDIPVEKIMVESLCLRQDIAVEKRELVEYIFFESGEGTLHINGTAFPLRPNLLLQVFPFHLYGITVPKGASLLVHRCRFPLSLLLYLDLQKRPLDRPDQLLEQSSPLVALSGDDARRIRSIWAEMIEETQGNEPFCYHFALSGLLRILALFDRTAMRQIALGLSLERSEAWRALQMIHMYFNKEGFDAAMVASRLDIDPTRLGYLLRSLTGHGFVRNLHEVRIRNVCAMMRFEELTIAFIARYVGYTSLATFHRVFKDLKGVTPDQYRTGTIGSAAVSRRDTAWTLLVYLLEHYNEPLKLSDVAEQLYLGETTATNILQANFSLGFPQLLERIRLSYACALLGAQTLPICDIALSVGFNSLRTFNRCFSQQLGTTPQRYRSSIRTISTTKTCAFL